MSQKTILITGASSGFGKLTVPLLLERGHTVIAGLRGGQERLTSLFASEMEKHAARFHAVDLHLEKPETFQAARRLIEERFAGKLDVLVNNAGYGLFGALETISPEQLRHEFEVNYFGPVFLTRALLPALREARGRVLSVSSIAGLMSYPFYGSYSASKFALEGTMEGLHYELKPFGVQVGLIEPGGFRTEFTRAKVFSPSEGSPYANRSQALERNFSAFDARLGDPARVARLIARLCERRRVPLRNAIGTDARLMLCASKVLPESVRMAMTDWAFRKAVFKD